MEHTCAFTPLILERWHRRENLLLGLALWLLREALITLRFQGETSTVKTAVLTWP